MGKKILVRADDLGYSKGVNAGIEESVRHGIIRSIGLMPNMPDAVEGYARIKDLDVCLGQHTNICVGKPLSDPASIPSLVDENGEFKSSKVYRAAEEDFVVLEEAILEIEAQYERFKEITGQEPSYFEGHAIASENFFKGLQIVAERHGLANLPFSLDGAVPFKRSQLVPSMDSMRSDYDPFATFKQLAKTDYAEDTYPMLVFHPGYLDAYLMKTSSLLAPRTLEVEMATSDEVKAWIQANEIELITYDDIQ